MRWEQLSPPLYRTPAGEAACSVAYEAALAAVPYPFEARRVSTRWGAAHVMVCGRSGAQPLVVWHGMGAPSPWMVRMFDQLEPHYRIYVPDLPSHGAHKNMVGWFGQKGALLCTGCMCVEAGGQCAASVQPACILCHRSPSLAPP